MTKTTLNTWVIGCGNTGQRVSQMLKRQNIKIKATSHSAASAIILEKKGLEVVQANLDTLSSLGALTKALEEADVYYFAPPQQKGETDQRVANFLDSLNEKKPPRRIVYISTTGVYGNHNGEWITEETPTGPVNARSKRRLDAENRIKTFCERYGTQYNILRVAGIYDLEKLPLKKINAGVKVLKIEIAPSSNRIHGADLANICIAAMQSTRHNRIFNVADGNPSSISDYFIQTARLFNLTPPEEIDWEKARDVLSPEMLSYLSESKKIDASKVLKELNITLQYPTLNEGLIACTNESK